MAAYCVRQTCRVFAPVRGEVPLPDVVPRFVQERRLLKGLQIHFENFRGITAPKKNRIPIGRPVADTLKHPGLLREPGSHPSLSLVAAVPAFHVLTNLLHNRERRFDDVGALAMVLRSCAGKSSRASPDSSGVHQGLFYAEIGRASC